MNPRRRRTEMPAENDETSRAVAQSVIAQDTSAKQPLALATLAVSYPDKLQNAILYIQGYAHLEPNEKPENVRSFLNTSPEAKAQLDVFRRYVPTRFLAPWFADKLRDTVDSRRDARIQELAKASQKT